MSATYKSQILSWDWERIVATARANPVEMDGQLVGTCYLGSVMSLVPSGKYYVAWSVNQTDDEVRRDQAWYRALDEVAGKFGGSVASGEGDPTDLYFELVLEDAPAVKPIATDGDGSYLADDERIVH